MRFIGLIALIAVTGACSNPGEDAPAMTAKPPSKAAQTDYQIPPASTSYAAAHAAAVAAIEQSIENGHGWNTAEALLQQGAAAAEAGDEDLAIWLTDEARMQADLSAIQAAMEEERWMKRVLSD